ncbi:MAG TPA: DUF5693 family protein, partial [Armatimonadota bacterium]|nr:DUF5693 family protein [Armatimonadota bacterium]
PTGLDQRLVQEIRGAGLEPVGRLNNALGAQPDSIRWALGRAKQMGVTTVIFAGEEVLGFKGLIPETAGAFRDLRLLYGSVELGKQRGDELLTKLLADQHVRVHSISSAEMPRLTPQEAVERYVRAAAERNIRLEYVRLPGSVSDHTFDDSIGYVDRLSDGIAKAGFGLASPVPFGRVLPEGFAGRLPRALIALGVGAGAVMLLAGLIPIGRGRQALLTVIAAALCAGLVLSGIGLGLQLVALLAAVVFPTLAFVLFPQPVGAFAEHTHASVRERTEAVIPAVYEFLAISLVTFIGALMVAGLLSELEFMVKIRSFAGIKVATVIPLLVVGWMY